MDSAIRLRHLVWLALLIATAVVVTLALAEATATRVVLAVTATAVVTAGALRKALFDPGWFSKVVGGLLLIPALIAGAIALEIEGGKLRPGVLGGVLAAASAAAFAYGRHVQRRPGHPELLAIGEERLPAVEDEGVQLAAYLSVPFDFESGRGELVVLAQSCIDAPRQVRVSLELVQEGWLHLATGWVAPQLPPGSLGPGEVSELRVSFDRAGSRAGAARLYLAYDASGPDGRRVRQWRAPPASRRSTGAAKVFALMFGHVIDGGGQSIPLVVSAAVAATPPRAEDPAPSWRSVWRPPPAP